MTALRRLTWVAALLTCSTVTANGQSPIGPTLLSPSYAVVIAVTQYKNVGWDKLETAEPDARAIQRLLERQGFLVTPLLEPIS